MSVLRSRAAWTLAAALSIVGFAVAASPMADEPGFVSLFNGKDLAGWEGDPSLWSVRDGAITGITTKENPLKYNQFLIWRGGIPKNFALRAKARVIGNNNSGIQYRSQEMTKVGKFSIGGYQCDIHPSANYNGMLYDERGRGIVAEAGQRVVIGADGKKNVAKKATPEAVKLDDWHVYEVIARGNRLIHKIDGKTTVDVIDHQESQRELEGLIALQIHAGPTMRVQVQEIALRTLPDGGVTGPNDNPPDDAFAAAKAQGKGAQAKGKAARKREAPQGPAPEATSIARLKTLPGFKVELVHAVPRETEGSWVSITIDPKNRLIVSDQYGKLYRVTPSAPGKPASDTKVEPIDVNIGGAHGLLWAFDSLYVMNNEAQGGERGLYRVRDTNGDDTLDKVELLRKIEGGGEHGPHAIVLAPDGKSLYVVAGNATKMPDLAASLVPKNWGEDNLIPHLADGAGFMTNEKAPGGWVCRIDPDGKNWTLVSMGYRNPYDIAFNQAGDLFTYDSDMEWDMNLPWYRPTRVCQVASGSDFGYRNGSGKWPTYYLDSLPPTVEVGPGSPTGIAFGYGAKFPARYQQALYICDWSYGKLYAVHLTAQGAGYLGTLEEFVTGTPLALTDLIVNPADGALYFMVGGRRTASGLYRVVFEGNEQQVQGNSMTPPFNMPREVRKQLEAFHGKVDPKALEVIWPNLGHPDRFVRYAARVALEWQDPDTWRDKALTETDPAKAIPALLALVHVSAQDPAHRKADEPGPAPGFQTAVLEALGRIDLANLQPAPMIDLVRLGQVLLVRTGVPKGDTAEQILARLRPAFPSASKELNRELAEVFVALEAPDAAGKVVSLLRSAPSQQEQIDLAKDLRMLQSGWTPALRKTFAEWIGKAGTYRGGNSFRGFMRQIRDAALANVPESERADFSKLAQPPAEANAAPSLPSRPFVRNWTMEELVPMVESGLHGRSYEKGHALFAATACFSCHRFDNEGGGAGPELTGLAGRFSPRDLLESIVLPNKVISDQYAAVQIATTDGEVVTGRIVNLAGDSISINTNMLDPNLQARVDRHKIESMKPSPVSMMPEGLLNTLNREEVLDLMAYLLSRGDRNSEVFKKP